VRTSGLRLAAYDPALAPVIAGWARGADELAAWASVDPAGAGPDMFARWHADPDVHPHVLRDGGGAVGYGEVWEDAAEQGAELARIIVEPARRGQGVGRALVRLLAQRAQELGYADIWVRVVPENGPALACYAAAGFRPVEPQLERTFNAGQPRLYRWLRFAGA
jgi:ribosomal protein S18 acetylase RimI-like enzyme